MAPLAVIQFTYHSSTTAAARIWPRYRSLEYSQLTSASVASDASILCFQLYCAKISFNLCGDSGRDLFRGPVRMLASWPDKSSHEFEWPQVWPAWTRTLEEKRKSEEAVRWNHLKWRHLLFALGLGSNSASDHCAQTTTATTIITALGKDRARAR